MFWLEILAFLQLWKPTMPNPWPNGLISKSPANALFFRVEMHRQFDEQIVDLFIHTKLQYICPAIDT